MQLLIAEIIGAFLLVYGSLMIKNTAKIKNPYVRTLILFSISMVVSYFLTYTVSEKVYINPSAAIIDYTGTVTFQYILILICCQVIGFFMAYALYYNKS